MSISAKLTELNNIKEDIKAALEYKGLVVSNQFDTYAEQIRSLGNADGREDPFATIGYYKYEQIPWLNKQVEQSQNVIDNWNPFNTKLTGTNIYFYPLIDTQKVTDMSYAFKNMTNLRSIALLDTARVTTMSNMFQGCTNLITIPEFSTPQLTNTSYMFDGCTLLENIPAIKTDKVTNLSYMFQNCKALKEIPLFLTNSVTNMSYMFNGCTSLKTAPIYAYNTSKVTNMSYMFNGCTSLEELNFIGCDLSKVTNWSNIVTQCSSLENVNFTEAKISNGFRFSYFINSKTIIYDNINTSSMTNASYLLSSISRDMDISNMDFSNVTNMSYMFNSNTSTNITIGSINTSKVKDMLYMFNGCTNITDLDLSGIDVSQVTDMQYMFSGCTKLVNLNLTGWNTDSLTNISYMFQNCSVLDNLDLSTFNTSKVNTMSYLFYNCKTNSLILDGWDFSSARINSNWLTGQTSKNVSLKNVKAKGIFTCPHASESIDLTGIDTTACTSFDLNSCDAPVIDLSSVNTSNFNTMYNMFNGCFNITSLDISHFDYSNVTNMERMFYNCSKLESITMGGSNRVTDMSEMFQGCSKLTKVDLTNLQLDLVTDMDNMFYGCKSLTEIIMGGNPAKITSSTYVDSMFYQVKDNGVFRYNSDYNYKYIIDKLPSTWKAEPLIDVSNCTSLTIEADDVTWRQTSTTIRYTAVVNGINPVSGATMTGITLTGKVQSDEFEQNLTNTDKTITLSYTLGDRTASTTITQSAYAPWSINLNNQWQLSTDVANPDSSLYDGVYESFSNRGVNNSSSICRITISGLETFSMYVRSDGEPSYDYVTVSDLDSTSTIKKSFQGLANSGTSIGAYTLVTFTNIDPSTDHTITIIYHKDSSSSSGTDRGYLLIPKNQ